MRRSFAFTSLLIAGFLVRPAAAQPMPDLVLDVAALASGTDFKLLAFAPDACELQAADLCVDAPGTRKLLSFDVSAINQGDADLVLGDPTRQPPPVDQFGNPLFVYSQCHGHYHFQSFARYELRARGGSTPVKTGSKRAFCVEDTRATTSTAPKKYTCQNQGIQAGWGDIYASNLKCQWIDVTDVPPGDYDLWVFLNTDHILPESDYDNNGGMTQVTIEAPGPTRPAPVVRLKAPHGKKARRVGHPLAIRWKARVRHGVKFQDVLFSQDGGTSFALLAHTDGGKIHSYRWLIPADAVTTQGVVKVVAWSNDLERGVATSVPFAVTP